MLHLTAKRKGGDLGLNFIKRCIRIRRNIIIIPLKIRTIFDIPHHRSQAAAIVERITTDARYGVADSYRSQAAAIVERITTDARYRVRNRYRCQAAATVERKLSDARYGVSVTIVGYGSGNDHIARVFTGVFIGITSAVGNCGS